MADIIILFLHFTAAVLCVVSTLGLMPPNTYVPKIDKLSWSEAIGLHLVETDTGHCLNHLAGADLVKLL